MTQNNISITGFKHGSSFIKKLRDSLSSKPLLFSFLRKIIELNFVRQKKIIRGTYREQGCGRVLDIGCGTGEFAPLFDRENYYGIDLLPAYILFARKARRGTFEVMDAKRLSFPDRNFDFVLIMAVLHHLNDDDASGVLKEARRVVKDQGTVLLLEDAKIPHLMNPLIAFIQSKDIGNHIRSPQNYRNLIELFFQIRKETMFRNGGCLYYSAVMKPRQGGPS
jgi:ubiquinone/menaquinone biosynthesis C-methylase UbiE